MSSFSIEQLEAEQITQAMKDGAFVRTAEIVDAIKTEIAVAKMNNEVVAEYYWRKLQHLVETFEPRLQKTSEELAWGL